MYKFILNMWIMRRITADQVNAFSPAFITQAQAEEIMEQPQISQ